MTRTLTKNSSRKRPAPAVPKSPGADLDIDRVAKYPRTSAIVPRKVWILGCDTDRIAAAIEFLTKRGHTARGAEPAGDVGATLRADRPDIVVIDLESDADRGRHLAVQLRADRGTRQLPIVMVGVASSEGSKVDRAVPGPTRRYAGSLDSASVLEAIHKDL
jgi:CheY-like chemotaxis protein